MILYQLELLKRSVAMPIIIYGDFNMLPSELEPSGCVDRLNAIIVKCNRNSTLQGNDTSYIDYFIVSNELVDCIKDVQYKLDVPWKPHIGLALTIQGSPRSITGNVLCVPKLLPMSIF